MESTDWISYGGVPRLQSWEEVNTGTYTVPDGEIHTTTHNEQVVTDQSSENWKVVLSVSMVVLSLFGAISPHLISKPVNRDNWQETVDKSNEWISTGSLSNVNPTHTVRINTIDDLIEIAVDTHTRVIHDPDEGVCAVIHDDTLYKCERPSPESPNPPEDS